MMNALFPENSYAGKCSCGKEFITPKGVIHCHVCLYAKIAELEKELDAHERQTHRFAVFICKTIAKLDGIPEFEPTKQMLSRLVSGNELQVHNLGQQAKGVQSVIDDKVAADDGYISVQYLKDCVEDFNEQAKQLREGVQP